jgi:glycosyltransferase involved in cell wall biosynthesis
MHKIKVSIVGTQGIPNYYGGFETLAEYLTQYLAGDFEMTVFCSSKVYPEKSKTFNNARLRYLPFSANGFSSILYDSVSLLLSLSSDRVIILGASGGFIMPLLRPWRKKFLLNLGGLDWQRSKWSPSVKWIIRLLEKLAVKNTGTLVSDNMGIREYLRNKYSKESLLIEYGGDQCTRIIPHEKDFIEYPFLKSRYAFSVARVQPDNNVEMILDSCLKMDRFPVVFVGNWKNSPYGTDLKAKYSGKKNCILLDAIYDREKLDLLRSNCYIYIHGHSAGGTNPALVEAMSLGLPVLAFASVFNRYTTEEKARFFSTSEELSGMLKRITEEELDQVKKDLSEIAGKRYKWSVIAGKYADSLK